MTCLRLAACAVLLALPATAQTTRADSLLDVFMERVQYDRRIERTFVADLPPLPPDIPRIRNVQREWERFYSTPWVLDRIRAVFLAESSATEVQSIMEWVENPIVSGAIAQDFVGSENDPGSEDELAAAQRMVDAMPPRRRAVLRRITRLAGDGLDGLRYQVESARAVTTYTMGRPLAPDERRTFDAGASDWLASQKADQAAWIVQIIALRFDGYPTEALEAYADALDTPPGQSYVRLITDSIREADLYALQTALRKAAK